MRVVWKFTVGLGDTTVQMPRGATVLSFQIQDVYGVSTPTLWALCDPEAEKEPRTFTLVGTGHPLCAGMLIAIGTAQQGPFAWHLFERGTPTRAA